jgi:hypothetical protein
MFLKDAKHVYKCKSSIKGFAVLRKSWFDLTNDHEEMTNIAKKNSFTRFNSEIMLPIYLAKRKAVKELQGKVDEGSIVAINEKEERENIRDLARELFGSEMKQDLKEFYATKASKFQMRRSEESVEMISKSIDEEVERRIMQSREGIDGAPNMGSPRGSENSTSFSTL